MAEGPRDKSGVIWAWMNLGRGKKKKGSKDAGLINNNDFTGGHQEQAMNTVPQQSLGRSDDDSARSGADDHRVRRRRNPSDMPPRQPGSAVNPTVWEPGTMGLPSDMRLTIPSLGERTTTEESVEWEYDHPNPVRTDVELDGQSTVENLRVINRDGAAELAAGKLADPLQELSISPLHPPSAHASPRSRKPVPGEDSSAQHLRHLQPAASQKPPEVVAAQVATEKFSRRKNLMAGITKRIPGIPSSHARSSSDSATKRTGTPIPGGTHAVMVSPRSSVPQPGNPKNAATSLSNPSAVILRPMQQNDGTYLSNSNGGGVPGTRETVTSFTKSHHQSEDADFQTAPASAKDPSILGIQQPHVSQQSIQFRETQAEEYDPYRPGAKGFGVFQVGKGSVSRHEDSSLAPSSLQGHNFRMDSDAPSEMGHQQSVTFLKPDTPTGLSIQDLSSTTPHTSDEARAKEPLTVGSLQSQTEQQPNGLAQIPDPQLASYSATYGNSQVDARVEEFLQAYGVVRRMGGADWLTTLFVWIRDELRRREQDKVTELSQKKSVLEMELAKKDQALKQQKKLVQEAEISVSQTKQKLEEERERLQQRQADIDAARGQIEFKDAEIENLRSNLQQANEFKATLQAAFDQSQADLSNMTAESNFYQKEYTKAVNTVQQTKDEMNAILAESSQKQEDIDHLSVKYANLKHDYEQLRSKYAGLKEKTGQREHELGRQIEILQADVRNADEAAAQHEREYEALANNVEERIASETSDLTHKVEKYKRQIASFNTGNYTAIPDSTFSQSLKTISQQISNLNSYVPRPAAYSFDQTLDPTNYLGRVGKQNNRHWPKFVKSVCWQVLFQGLSKYPLGFGALGSVGEGYEALLQLYQLFARPSLDDPTGISPVLPNDKDTNGWRAAFFDAILRSVKANPGGSDHLESHGYAVWWHRNVAHVTQDLTDKLQQLCNGALDGRAPAQISAVVYELGILALEMGSQRSHVYLDVCMHGEHVKPGERFNDELDSRAGEVSVDLMTQPCMVRVGDGREDLNSEKVIVKGDFISLKTG